ncbi:hypothetical protein ACFTY7_46095, partial [Streptomyces sp. NPDC057062]|uniref:hypothetical protein n=1 Tax=Streptomyces sp. NPDC057062 TaxID=3346011 RepID=UPI003633250E
NIRYLSEFIEFNEEEDQIIFRQRFEDGKFLCETGKISEDLKSRLAETNISLNFPENQKETHYIPQKKESASTIKF